MGYDQWIRAITKQKNKKGKRKLNNKKEDGFAVWMAEIFSEHLGLQGCQTVRWQQKRKKKMLNAFIATLPHRILVLPMATLPFSYLVSLFWSDVSDS